MTELTKAYKEQDSSNTCKGLVKPTDAHKGLTLLYDDIACSARRIVGLAPCGRPSLNYASLQPNNLLQPL